MMSLLISAFFTFLIQDPEKPILCPHQEEDIDRSPPVNVPSAAVLEISENMRAKIYSIFCKLGKEVEELHQVYFFQMWAGQWHPSKAQPAIRKTLRE